MKKFLFSAILLSLVFACNSDNITPLIYNQVIIDENLFADASTDDFDLINAEISGDSLKITLRYGGGCGNIGIKLLSSVSILKTNPPGRQIRILFSDHDSCEALASKEVSFDLTPLRSSGDQEVSLRLEGWNGELVYRY